MNHLITMLLVSVLLLSCGNESNDTEPANVGAVCEKSSDCSSGLECEGGTCEVHVHGESCSQHADCQTGEKCNDGECVNEQRIDTPVDTHQHTCTKDTDCEHGTCEDGVCNEYKACQTEADCEPGEECKYGECAPMRSVAADGCQSDEDCPNGHKCDWKAECCNEKNQCKPFGSGECKTNKDCPDGKLCFESVCYRNDITYTKEIAPLYQYYCFQCHGEELVEGGWKWNDYNSLVSDSYSCPGHSKAECTLIRIRNKSLPTGGDKSEEFTSKDIGLLAAWIAGGMKK